jgi:hypothetical protein
MLSNVELAALIVLAGSVAAYAIGATIHVVIDWVHGKRMLREYWDKTDNKIAHIEEDVVRALSARLDEVKASAPVLDTETIVQRVREAVSAELAELHIEEDVVRALSARLDEVKASAPVLDTETIVQRVREAVSAELAELHIEVPPLDQAAVDQIATAIGKSLEFKARGVVGGRMRTQQHQVVQQICSSVDFGQPVLNAAWTLLPIDAKTNMLNRLVKAMRRAGLQIVPIAVVEGHTVDETAEEETGLFQLEDGSRSGRGRW